MIEDRLARVEAAIDVLQEQVRDLAERGARQDQALADIRTVLARIEARLDAIERRLGR
jgi:chromosome segregation ATPase